MIFYFTGTGNSLYIAKQIEANPISIPQMVKEFLTGISKMPADAWQHLLRVTDACIGCGICEKVCPSASIHVVNGNGGIAAKF